MPIKFAVIVVALAASLTSAHAADMAHRSRLGAVFAEPPVVVRGPPPIETVVTVDPGYVRNSPRLAGYYGQAGDFQYRNYYGTPRSLLHIYSPFTCVIEAIC